MKIEKDKSVALAYTLTVNGETVETVGKEKPMEFIFGQGFLLPKFEDNILGKEIGENFEFELKAADAYGEIIKEAFVELSKEVFKVNGEIDTTLFKIGNVIPMRDAEGNRMDGVISEIKNDTVVMNFNHPLAGQDLHFKGSVVNVRETTDEELSALQHQCNCGGNGNCDCNGEGGDCDCHHGEDGCEGDCHCKK